PLRRKAQPVLSSHAHGCRPDGAGKGLRSLPRLPLDSLVQGSPAKRTMFTLPQAVSGRQAGTTPTLVQPGAAQHCAAILIVNDGVLMIADNFPASYAMLHVSHQGLAWAGCLPAGSGPCWRERSFCPLVP